MRYLLVLLGGIVCGAVLAFIAANTLLQRDAYPRSVMQILQHHVGALRQARRRGDCGLEGLRRHWTGMANLALEIDPAFAARAPEPAFSETSQRFVRLMTTLAQSPPVDCATLDHAQAQINEACEDCHRQYR